MSIDKPTPELVDYTETTKVWLTYSEGGAWRLSTLNMEEFNFLLGTSLYAGHKIYALNLKGTNLIYDFVLRAEGLNPYRTQ